VAIAELKANGGAPMALHTIQRCGHCEEIVRYRFLESTIVFRGNRPHAEFMLAYPQQGSAGDVDAVETFKKRGLNYSAITFCSALFRTIDQPRTEVPENRSRFIPKRTRFASLPQGTITLHFVNYNAKSLRGAKPAAASSMKSHCGREGRRRLRRSKGHGEVRAHRVARNAGRSRNAIHRRQRPIATVPVLYATRG
jgi:hypothetical protein